MKLKFLFLGLSFFALTEVTHAQNIGQSTTQYNGNIYHMGGNVGIGTTTPKYKLDIGSSSLPGMVNITNDNYGDWILRKSRSDNTQVVGFKSFENGQLGIYANNIEGIRISSDGKVGIGCDPGIATLKIYKESLPSFELASPNSRLEIGVATHEWAFAPTSQIGDIVFRPLGGGIDAHHGMILWLPNDQNDGKSYIKFGDGKNGLWIGIFNDRNFRIDGSLYATKIYVKTNVWSDYVFDPDYKLKSLEEIETFINENKHLPDVPSAKEVIEEGIDVAGMNAILLRKVEELTLLMIEQNKTIQELQSRLDKLQK